MRRRRKLLLGMVLSGCLASGLVGYAVARQQAQIASESLLEAAENGHPGRVAFLLSLGQDPNERDSVGWTPLHSAAYWGNARIARDLLEHGADPNARTEDTIGAPDMVSPAGYEAPLKTPLFAAAAGGHPDVARVLLDRGAQPSAPGYWGETALHRAAMQGETAVASLLIARGADVNAKTKTGETPLHWAVRGHGGFHWSMPFGEDANREKKVNSAAVVQLLLGAGASVDARDDKGWTPLHWAATYGHVDLARILVTAGADPNIKVKDLQAILPQRRLRHGYGGPGQTPLHLAIGEGDSPALVAYLLAHGANPDIKDADGRTALDVAIKCGCEDCQRLLKKHGAKTGQETAP